METLLDKDFCYSLILSKLDDSKIKYDIGEGYWVGENDSEYWVDLYNCKDINDYSFTFRLGENFKKGEALKTVNNEIKKYKKLSSK